MTSLLQSPEDVVEWIDACVLGDLRTLFTVLTRTTRRRTI